MAEGGDAEEDGADQVDLRRELRGEVGHDGVAIHHLGGRHGRRDRTGDRGAKIRFGALEALGAAVEAVPGTRDTTRPEAMPTRRFSGPAAVRMA